jgi:hypothetical protein
MLNTNVQNVWPAISAEIRSGNLTRNALDSLQQAFEMDLVSADEKDYLEEILVEAGVSH